MNIFKKWLYAIIGIEERIIDLPEEELEIISGVSSKETGKDNAKKFIAHVLKDAILEKVVVIEYDSKWIWMRNPEWRDYVIFQLSIPSNNSPFASARFSPPDDYDDSWTFAGYLKENSRKVEDLSLSDSL